MIQIYVVSNHAYTTNSETKNVPVTPPLFPLIVATTPMYINKYTMERMVNARFMCSLESQRLLSENQCGFVHRVILFIVKRSRWPYWFMYYYFKGMRSNHILRYCLQKKKKKKSRSLQYNVEIKHRFRWSVAFRFHVSFTSVHRRSLSHRHYNVRICSSLPQLCVNTTWVLHKVTSCLLLFLTQTLTTFRNCTRTCYMKQRRSFPSRSLAK